MQQTEQHESQAAFARRIGRSRSQVSRYRASGMPVASDGSVPVREALQWVRQNVSGADGGDDTLASKKARKLEVECERAELALRKERGELVDRERAERMMHDLAKQVSEAWQAWPARAAPGIAARLKADPQAVEQVLSEEVRTHLANMSASLRGQTE